MVVLNRGATTGVSFRDMRNLGTRSAALTLVLVATVASARADDLAGAYDVKFDQVSTNCEHTITYPAHGLLKIEVKGNDMQVDIERTPLMVGKPTKNGKVSARSPRPGHTPYEGMDGVFSVAGKISPEGIVSLVMIGEYQAAGKPLCTQSWNLIGIRARPGDKPAGDKPAGDKPGKPDNKPKR
jgi:hypothetical protein